MEYGNIIGDKNERSDNGVGSSLNDNFNRYVGYDATVTPFERELFSDSNIQKIADKVSELMACLGRPVILTKKAVGSAVSNIFYTYRPQLGDIYTIYNIPAAQPRDDLQTINEQAIELIYNQLKTQYEIEENNKKLTVWTTLLGDFNEHGLRQYSTLKINHKNINKMRFNMNY